MRLPWIVSIFFLMVSPASADWQYTKWGMTQDQVIAASKGEARKVNPGPNFVCNDKQIPFAAIQKKVIGDFSFDVIFCSKMQGGPLTSVRLDSNDNVNVYSLKRALLAQFGRPALDRGDTTIWNDQKSGNTISLFITLGTSILEYRSNKSGF